MSMKKLFSRHNRTIHVCANSSYYNMHKLKLDNIPTCTGEGHEVARLPEELLVIDGCLERRLFFFNSIAPGMSNLLQNMIIFLQVYELHQ